MRKVYTFHVDCGRAGDLRGKFTADDADVAAALGKEVHLYEPWGKHSSCSVTLEAAHFVVVTSDPAEVAMFDRLDLRSGECPLGILADQEAGAASDEGEG